MSAVIRIRTRYLSATDTQGSRIRVYWESRQYTEGFDHSARDPHAAAAGRALQVAPELLTPMEGTLNGKRFELACAHKGSTNHSADLVLVAHGAESRLPLCGYHSSWERGPLLDTLRAAGVIQ